MRVFLDTNVLVSGFATRGLCADVIRLTLAEHELVVGQVVLNELARVLSQKLKLPASAVSEILAFLESQIIQPKPKTAPDVRIQDEDDRWVLASALAAKVDVLVTGDRDLLEIREQVTGLLITDPRGFWSLATKRSK